MVDGWLIPPAPNEVPEEVLDDEDMLDSPEEPGPSQTLTTFANGRDHMYYLDTITFKVLRDSIPSHFKPPTPKPEVKSLSRDSSELTPSKRLAPAAANARRSLFPVQTYLYTGYSSRV